MKTCFQIGILAVLSVVLCSVLTLSADAQPASADSGADARISASVTPGGPMTIARPWVKNRVGGPAVRGQDPPFPSFDEVPHGEPGWAANYSHSYYDENGRLWDVYKFPGLTVAASTNYYLDQ